MNYGVMLIISAIIGERGAENCLLRDSALNDVVPEARLKERMNYMNESSCRTDRRELNLDIE